MAAAALKQELQPIPYTVKIAPAQIDTLTRLAADMGWSVEAVMAGIVEAHCRDIELGIIERAPPEEMAAIARGIAQFERGEFVSQDDLMAQIRAKHGW